MCRRGPCQTGDRLRSRVHQKFQVFSHRLRVTERMILLDEAIKKRFLRLAPHLTKLQRPDGAQRNVEWRDREVQFQALTLPRNRVSFPAGCRQFNLARPMEYQQQTPAHSVAQCAVRLSPRPRLAQLQRKLPAADARMCRDQLTDELHFCCADHSAPIAKLACHVPERSRDRNRTQVPNRKTHTNFFIRPLHSLVATSAPPGWPSDRPPRIRPAVGGPPGFAPHPEHCGSPATSEIVLAIIASAPTKILGRRKRGCGSPSRAGCEIQTSNPRMDRSEVSPGTSAPVNRCPCDRLPLRQSPECASAE